MSNFHPDELRLRSLCIRPSEEELAASVWVSKSAVCRIERAEKGPFLDEIHTVASAFRSGPDELGSDADGRNMT